MKGLISVTVNKNGLFQLEDKDYQTKIKKKEIFGVYKAHWQDITDKGWK